MQTGVVCLISSRNVSVGPTLQFSIQRALGGPCKFRKFGPPKPQTSSWQPSNVYRSSLRNMIHQGDGVLSEEEMLSVPLANVFFKMMDDEMVIFRLLSLSSGAVMWDGLKCEAVVETRNLGRRCIYGICRDKKEKGKEMHEAFWSIDVGLVIVTDDCKSASTFSWRVRNPCYSLFFLFGDPKNGYPFSFGVVVLHVSCFWPKKSTSSHVPWYVLFKFTGVSSIFRGGKNVIQVAVRSSSKLAWAQKRPKPCSKLLIQIKTEWSKSMSSLHGLRNKGWRPRSTSIKRLDIFSLRGDLKMI